LVTVHGNKDAECLSSLVDVKAFQFNAIGAIDVSDGEGSWAFLKAGVSPVTAFEDELDEKPVAFGRYEGATGSAEAAFPCIYYVLHFVNKIRCV
jgi:hypothetical protein